MESQDASHFQTTRWSMVLYAGAADQPGAMLALDQLCRLYWRPLFVYCCRSGRSQADAEDLTQGYFAQLLARGSLRLADPGRGRFRTFLLSSFKNYLIDMHRQGDTTKRGGKLTHLSFEMDVADGCLVPMSAEAGPERVFDKQWANDVVQRATRRLREEYVKTGKVEWFDSVAGDKAGSSYETLAIQFGSTEAAVKSFALRVRKRFRALLEQEIADTVAAPEEIPGEMAYLAELLKS